MSGSRRDYGSLKVTNPEFQAAEIGVVVVLESEGYIESIADDERVSCKAIGHTPGESLP